MGGGVAEGRPGGMAEHRGLDEGQPGVRYPELGTEDEIADEVLATYSGRRGAERLREARRKHPGKEFGEALGAIEAMNRVREALQRFWSAVADFLHINYRNAEEVADRVMRDLLEGVNPVQMGQPFAEDTEVKVVGADADHGFRNFDEARAWAKAHIARTYGNEETGGKGEIRISNNAIDKYLSESVVSKSESKDVHLSVLRKLPEVIRESIDAEQHPDYKKGEDNRRDPKNGINQGVRVHRLYGAVNIDGEVYRVKTTVYEYTDQNRSNSPHSYEATKIELLAGTLADGENATYPRTNSSITVAKLLKGVEKSYEPGEFLLDGYAGKQDEDIRFRSSGEGGSSEGREAKERAARQLGVRLAGFRLECMENRRCRFLQPKSVIRLAECVSCFRRGMLLCILFASVRIMLMETGDGKRA